ncbi:TetR/AcrR family transcriptional regulator [Gordonia sp. SL306]|uniref:TetR/AcrR family transcriptional regulator n=1 Tax=Gordonia sp. SL306 TaxID=2995145 RepID=UPI002271D5C6|nr:TetR/AcrR family transcriptional regulator [Gordonia sp. SL306]WAC57063.1 TetR/AcrR family transcriptional regulator [Gordonia sp. SL306]
MSTLDDVETTRPQHGRAERTRAAILEATRRQFLERGYAGTTVNAIAASCGISRAGFYTYFKDKREVFGLLGERAYRDLRSVLASWDSFDEPDRVSDVRAFVRAYFGYLDRHGAFAMSATHSAPDDDEFRRGNTRMQTRLAWILGQAIGPPPDHSPEVVGSAAFGLLDRSWYTVRTQTVAIDEAEMVEFLTAVIHGMGARR